MHIGLVNQDISSLLANYTLEVSSYNALSIGIEILQGSDDGGTNPGDCAFYNTDNEVYLGACFEGGDITSGFRFQNVQVPRNANLADLLYGVRDELLNTTPEGQRLSDLYYTYIPNIVQVLIAYPELSVSSFETMNLFAPSLQALLDRGGDSVIVTAEQVQGLQSFLDALIQYGDEDLQSIISSELKKPPLENMIGLTLNEAWSQINGYEFEWLSPIGNSNPYVAQQGSTISVKFTLTDFEGNFVEDESVYLQITDSNGNVVFGPILVSNNPNNGIKIQGNQYHYNLKTKDLPLGSYTLEVFYNNETQSEIKTINLTKK